MDNVSKTVLDVPPDQRAIRARCFHPKGTFVEFPKEEVARYEEAKERNEQEVQQILVELETISDQEPRQLVARLSQKNADNQENR